MSDPAHQHIHQVASDAPAPTGFFQNLFESFTPRRLCMNLEPDVIWLHVFSDLFITLAYYSIPIALVYFVRRRRDLEFNWMFLMFAAFILACGTTHLFGIWAIWNPMYRIDGLIKAATAGISVTTAILLWPLIPKALALPSPGQLREANERLEREIQERRAAQDELTRSNDALELRVEERTKELAEMNRVLQAEIGEREQAERERRELLARERAARTEAQNANRAKDDFLATLSHELRTPLNAILGWSRVLGRPNVDAQEMKQGLETIERSVRTQTRMIEDLLDTSRIIAGKIQLDAQRLIPHSIVEAAIEAVRPAAETKGVHLQIELDPSAGPITGDANRLQQVVWNLLANAIKFTPKGGLIQILLKRVNSHIELTIKDNGQGISPEFVPFVFERFQQADSSATRRFGGLGLGLSIVKHLVELHGGAVRVESPGEGKGAAFIVTLPSKISGDQDGVVQVGVAPVRTSQPTGFAAPSLQGLRVLVVDDESDARELLRRILSQQSAQVVTASSADSAMAAYLDFNPDVLVCDIGMPEKDGYELLKEIRSLPSGQGAITPAIAVTAFAGSEDRRSAFAAGFQVHLSKPVDPAELIAVIANVAQGRRKPG